MKQNYQTNPILNKNIKIQNVIIIICFVFLSAFLIFSARKEYVETRLLQSKSQEVKELTILNKESFLLLKKVVIDSAEKQSTHTQVILQHLNDINQKIDDLNVK